MIKAVLFDLDGTLLNTNDLILNSFKYTLKEVLGIEVSEEELSKTFGRPLIPVLEYYSEEKLDDLVTVFREYNEANHDAMCKPFEGVKELIVSLKENGFKLGIVTSKRVKMAKRGCDISGLTEYFDTFITPECTDKHKPHGEPILKACYELGVEPKEVIMVGDAPADILSGKNAGSKTCAVKYTAIPLNELEVHSPDFFVDTPLEILDIVK